MVDNFRLYADIGYLRGRPEKHEQHEIPALPVAKPPPAMAMG